MSEAVVVPFVGQIGLGADAHLNDCGPACALMVARAQGRLLDMSVDQAYDLVAPAGDKYTSWNQLKQIMEYAGIDAAVQHDLRIGELFEMLVDGRPPICLVNYGVIKPYSHYPGVFTGAHFVVLVDMNPGTAIIHDPLTGPSLHIPMADWKRAHDSTPGNLLRYAALVEVA